MSSKPVVKRKKPGRPKKVSSAKNIKFEGVKDTGLKENTVMELIYHDPVPLRKMMSLFKSMNVQDLTFHFTKEKATIYTQDHFKKTILKVDILGSKIYRYYCSEEFKITIDPHSLEEKFNLLTPSCEKIMFYSEKNKQHSTLSLMIDCIKNLGTNSTHNISLIKSNPFSEKIPDTDLYPLSMEINSKAFKLYINNIHSCSDEFTIQKENDSEIVLFRYISRDKKTDNNIIRFYNNPGKGIKINYKSDDKEYLFLTSVRCEYCKPLSNILLSDKIILRAHKTKRLNFEVHINDGACIINVYTEIIQSKSSFGI